MKNLLFFLLFLGLSMSCEASKPIFSITKYDGGRNGYSYVEAHLETNSQGLEGWVVECHSPGFEKCRRPMSSSAPAGDLDATDLSIGEELLNYADDAWDDGVKSGNHSMNVQAAGETFIRQYVVSWVVVERKIHIEVVRNDIYL